MKGMSSCLLDVQSMASHFEDIGLDIHSEAELRQLIENLFAAGREVKTAAAVYRLITIDEAIEIWLVMKGQLIDDFEIHYSTGTRTMIKFAGWTELNEAGTSGLAYVWNSPDEDDAELFPTNLCIPAAGCLAGIKTGRYPAQIAAFAEEVSLYRDVDAYHVAEDELAPQAFMPIGSFSLSEEDEAFVPEATVVMSAVIDSIERKVNSYSSLAYYLLQVHCLDLRLDVLLTAADMPPNINVGGIISGTFYLSGHIFC